MPRSPFDALAAASAEPSVVRRVLDDLDGDAIDRLGADPTLARVVCTVAAASNSLGRLVVAGPSALDALADLDRAVAVDSSSPDRLVESHHLAFLQIAALDLAGGRDLAETTAALSDLAGRVLDGALRATGADDLAVIGMGKLGAGELNYVSDVDVLLVGDGDPVALERRARSFVALAGRCFHVDLGLRPEGRDGPLVRTLDSYRSYWDRWARPWEFQALLKARPVAGEPALGAAFASAADESLWGRPFDDESLREVRRLKQRAEQAVVGAGLADRDIKRGWGGIRDIEFSVQLLQLVHGRADPLLRARATRDALEELSAGGFVEAGEAMTLWHAYVLLRRVEHAAQLLDERRTHLVPDERAARRRLARVLGFRGDEGGGPTDRFDEELRRHRVAVRKVHEGWYFRPLLASFVGAGALEPAAAEARLSAFGFTSADRTRQAVAELSGGLSRSSRLMRQMLPLLLDWLSDAPDPDRGLLGLRRLAAGPQRSLVLAGAFRDSPETARTLCRLAGSSVLAIELLEANPDLVARLDDPAKLRTLDRPDLVASAQRAVTWRASESETQPALRRWWRRHLLGVVARDLLGSSDPEQVGADLTRLAEIVLEVGLALLEPRVPVAVIGFGRLGGGRLSYASDADVVIVHGGDTEADAAEAERVAAGLLRVVAGATPASRIIPVDPDLRPEGRSGPLARSLDSYEVYLDRWAETWEHQALLRARVVAGDGEVGRRFLALVDRHLEARPDADARRAMRRMKARIERQRLPPGDDARLNLKLGPGALVDIEFTVQALQWSAGIGRCPSTLDALARLTANRSIEAPDAAVLDAAHRLCDRVRNRRFLVVGQGDGYPTRPEDARVLARSLDATPGELLDEYLRVTRRCRAVVERLFYQGG